jgi:hypothetical protein
MEMSSVFEWCKWFKEVHENVDDKRSGHPVSHKTNENLEKVWNLVRSNRHLSISYGYATKFR